jgi:hypothetical protein
MIPHSQKLRLGTGARPAKVSGVWNSRVEDGRGTLGHAATLAKLTTMRRAGRRWPTSVFEDEPGTAHLLTRDEATPARGRIGSQEARPPLTNHLRA